MSGVTLASTLPLPELPVTSRGPVTCEIQLKAGVVGPAAVEWFHRWRIGGRTWLRFGRQDAGYLLRFPALSDFFVTPDGAGIDCHPAAGLPRGTLRHLLLDQVLPLALTLTGRLVLHASAVHIPGFGTVAFAGESGRGKSTLAAALASRGGDLVTDDTLVLDGEGAEVMAVPGYPGVRLWPDQVSSSQRRGATAVAHYTSKRRLAAGSVPFRTRPSPLRAIYILSPRARGVAAAEFSRCGPRARLMGLVRFAQVMDVEDRARLAQLFHRLGGVAARVPVARLRLRHSRAATGLAAEAVERHARAMHRSCTT